MAGLLEPYVPDSSKWFRSASEGYALGDAMRNRDVSVNAGALAAQGNLKGARNALYAGGNFDDAGKVDDRMIAAAQRAKTADLEKAAKFNGLIGSLAMSADTPEKWATAIATAKRMGLDVSRYADFGSRDFAIAQAGKTKDFLDLELNRRKADILEEKTAASVAARNQPKPRNLGYGDIEKLAKKGSQLENVDRYATTFQDQNAGYGRGGEATMWIARNLPFLTGPKTENAATWWQDYDRYKNIVRNELFGSALTAAETEAFERSDINPNMDPRQIRLNLARQQEAVKSALRKTTSGLKASGYPEEAVDAASGVTAEQLQAAPTPGGTNRIDLNKGTRQPGSKSDPLGILD